MVQEVPSVVLARHEEIEEIVETSILETVNWDSARKVVERNADIQRVPREVDVFGPRIHRLAFVNEMSLEKPRWPHALHPLGSQGFKVRTPFLVIQETFRGLTPETENRNQKDQS